LRARAYIFIHLYSYVHGEGRSRECVFIVSVDFYEASGGACHKHYISIGLHLRRHIYYRTYIGLFTVYKRVCVYMVMLRYYIIQTVVTRIKINSERSLFFFAFLIIIIIIVIIVIAVRDVIGVPVLGFRSCETVRLNKNPRARVNFEFPKRHKTRLKPGRRGFAAIFESVYSRVRVYGFRDNTRVRKFVSRNCPINTAAMRTYLPLFYRRGARSLRGPPERARTFFGAHLNIDRN